MIEKILGNISNVHLMNQTAEKLRQLGMKEELEKLAEYYAVPKQNVEAFFIGKRHFLVDGGPIQKNYHTVRSKLMDEMALLNDPQFADVIGNYLLKQCNLAIGQQILQPHKTLQRCVEYLMEQAWKLVDEEKKKQKIQVGFAVPENTVYRWIEDYYALDDKEQCEKVQKKADEMFCKARRETEPKKEKKRKVPAKSTTQVKANKTAAEAENDKKLEPKQLSLFDPIE